MVESGDQSIVTLAPASSGGKTQKNEQRAVSSCPHLTAVMRLVLQTQAVHCGDSPDKGSEWWDGAGGFARSRQSQGRSDVAAFTLKPWRWEGAPACLETNANPENLLHGRMCLLKENFRNKAQVSFDLRCQHELRRQKPWPRCRLTPMHTVAHPSSLWQRTLSHPIPCYHSSLTYPSLSYLPQCRTKTSCNSNKPLLDHKGRSGNRLGLLKMSGMLPGAGSLSPTSPAPRAPVEGLKSRIEDSGDVRAG